MNMHLVDEFVKIVLMSLTKIYKGLHGLVWISGNVLALCLFHHGDHVIYESGKVGNAAIDIGGLVNADEGFVEDCEKVAEKLQGNRLRLGENITWAMEEKDLAHLLDDAHHHYLVPLSSVHLKQLLQVGEQLCSLSHFRINLLSQLIAHFTSLGQHTFSTALFQAT